MSDTLLIVESPAKAKTIGKYLGGGFQVKASMGHIRDLPQNKIAVDVDQEFQPTFEVMKDKKEVVSGLRASARKAGQIFLAADPDREGEAICYHLSELLKDTGKPIRRVLFHEITRGAVQEAIKSPADIDPHKVSAQIARRIIDRLVGYQISPLLWDKVRKGLSAGRVQTVALRIITERERQIRAFNPEEYWVVSAELEGASKEAFSAKLARLNGKKASIRNADENTALRKALENQAWTIASIEKKRQKRTPPPPFTTSKLQQEASRLLRFPVKKTMSVAQRLYEGIDLAGGDTVGLITYMRTDSTRLSPQAVAQAREFIGQAYGKDYLPAKARGYAPAKKAQDAHEAIRPTDVTRTPESVKKYLRPDQLSLYRLIWNRFVACQMAEALFDNTKVSITCGKAEFAANGSIMVFPGFKTLYTDADEANEKNRLPALNEGEVLKLLDLKSEQKFTEPPPRFTEATLVKALEENGIGRPSTYATIISTIQDRHYVAKEKAYLVPSDMGMLVSDILVEHFPGLFDVNYTASMEGELDKIEAGDEKRAELLQRFWSSFSKELEAAKGNMADLRKEGVATDEVCDKCGKPMVLKMGRFGRFYACSGYPECKNTKPVEDETPPDVPEGEETCEKCGGKMAVRRGRFGPFLACENYPDCKNTKKLKQSKDGSIIVQKDEKLDEKCPECGAHLVRKQGRYGPFTACSNYPKCKYIKKDTVDMKCPKCGKPLAKRFTRRRKLFFGCTGYPDCDFLSWDPILDEKCPKCGSTYLLVKKRRGGESIKKCPDKECGFESPFEINGSKKSAAKE